MQTELCYLTLFVTMSQLFSKAHIILPTQHDKEVKKPSALNDIVATCSDKGIINDDDITITIEDYAIECSTKKEKPNAASSSSSDPDGKKQRTSDDVLATQLKLKLKKMEAAHTNCHAKYKVGAQVYTINAKIALLSNQIPPGRTKKVHLPLFGTIVKRSKFYPRFWLVNFYDGQSWYVTLDVIHLRSKASPSF